MSASAKRSYRPETELVHALVNQRKSVSNCSSAIFRDLSFVCFADLANWHDRPHIRRAPTKQTHGAGKEGTCCALACRR